MNKWVIVTGLVLGFFLWNEAGAQIQGLKEGEKVRIITSKVPIDTVVGILIEIKNNSLTVENNREAATIPFSSISQIQINRGKRQTWKGAKIGAVFTGALSALMVVGTCSSTPWMCTSNGKGDSIKYAMAGAVFGGFVGGVIGAGLGSLSKEEKWVTLQSNEQNMPLQKRIYKR
ncbi:MAG: hypothetical protein PVH63_04320 [Balneolaceae bacterium]|jgi:hypothetical protein